MTLNLPAPGNWGGEMNIQAQPAPENWSETRTSKSEGQRWNSTICKSSTIDILRKSSRTCGKLNFAEEAPVTGVEALKTNVLMWGLFTSTTMKAAIHLGPNYVDILKVYRNTSFEELQNLFHITQKLILDHQAEILNVTTIDWTAPSWASSSLSHDQVTTWTNDLELMENRWCSSGIFSQDLRHWRSSRRSRKTCKIKIPIVNPELANVSK